MANKTICSTKTKTTIVESSVNINCFADENDLGTTKPNLYSANLLTKKSHIDGVNGKEGELIICFDKEPINVAELDLGNMTLNMSDDDANKYSLDLDGNLIYSFV